VGASLLDFIHKPLWGLKRCPKPKPSTTRLSERLLSWAVTALHCPGKNWASFATSPLHANEAIPLAKLRATSSYGVPSSSINRVHRRLYWARWHRKTFIILCRRPWNWPLSLVPIGLDWIINRNQSERFTLNQDFTTCCHVCLSGRVLHTLVIITIYHHTVPK